MTTGTTIQILTDEQVKQKITRLAFQVYERNFEENELFICGIAGRGFELAERLYNELKRISPLKLTLSSVKINKEKPNTQTIITPDVRVENGVVILCDDVLYTGKTMAYAALPFLQAGVRKLQCLVLVHRNHLSFPIQPSFIGMSLASTLQEHVEVRLGKESCVLLS